MTTNPMLGGNAFKLGTLFLQLLVGHVGHQGARTLG